MTRSAVICRDGVAGSFGPDCSSALPSDRSSTHQQRRWRHASAEQHLCYNICNLWHQLKFKGGTLSRRKTAADNNYYYFLNIWLRYHDGQHRWTAFNRFCSDPKKKNLRVHSTSWLAMNENQDLMALMTSQEKPAAWSVLPEWCTSGKNLRKTWVNVCDLHRRISVQEPTWRRRKNKLEIAQDSHMDF